MPRASRRSRRHCDRPRPGWSSQHRGTWQRCKAQFSRRNFSHAETSNHIKSMCFLQKLKVFEKILNQFISDMAELSELAHFIWWKMCKARSHLDSQTAQLGAESVISSAAALIAPVVDGRQRIQRAHLKKAGTEITRPGTKCGHDSDKTQMNDIMLTPDLIIDLYAVQLGGGAHLSRSSNLTLFWRRWYQINSGVNMINYSTFRNCKFRGRHSGMGTLVRYHLRADKNKSCVLRYFKDELEKKRLLDNHCKCKEPICETFTASFFPFFLHMPVGATGFCWPKRDVATHRPAPRIWDKFV